MDYFKGLLVLLAVALGFCLEASASADPSINAKMSGSGGAQQAAARPEKAWYLAATDPKAGLDEVEQAAAGLLSPAEWAPFESAAEVMEKFTKARNQRRAILSNSQEANVTRALGNRLDRLLKSTPKDAALPAQAVNLACLLSRWNTRGGRESLSLFLARVRQAPKQKTQIGDLLASEPDHSLLFRLLDELIQRRFPKAATTFRAVFEHSDHATLASMANEQGFLAVLGHHPNNPEVAKVLNAMFLDPESDWNLSKATYSAIHSYGNAGLLKAASFRQALRSALENQEITGTLTVKADKPSCCWIQWGNVQSGQGIDDDEPVGAEPGGKAMPVRRCDTLLEGLANCASRENPGPKFHIYWPLERREAARKAWIEFLGGN